LVIVRYTNTLTYIVTSALDLSTRGCPIPGIRFQSREESCRLSRRLFQADEKGRKSKERLEEEKRAILKQRIRALDIDGADAARLADKAKELLNLITRLESEKYDLEKSYKARQMEVSIDRAVHAPDRFTPTVRPDSTKQSCCVRRVGRCELDMRLLRLLCDTAIRPSVRLSQHAQRVGQLRLRL